MAFDALEYVRGADIMKFDLSYDYIRQTPLGLFDLNQTIDPSPFCVWKTEGDLAFRLSTNRHLWLTPDIPLELRGTAMGGADPRIIWRVQPALSLASVPSYISIDSVEGGFVTALTEQVPLRRDSCMGLNRSFRAHMILAPEEPRAIVVKGKALGSDITLTIALKQLDGAASKWSDYQVRIELLKNECGIGAVAGGKARFWGAISGAPVGEAVRRRWSVDGAGAVPDGRTDDFVFHVQLGGPGTITVRLEAVVGGETFVVEMSVLVLTVEEAYFIERACKLAHIVKWRLPIRLIPAPAEPEMLEPLSLVELLDLRDATAEIRRLVDQAIVLAERAAGSATLAALAPVASLSSAPGLATRTRTVAGSPGPCR